VTDAPPLPDAPRVSTAHGGAETWSDDDEPDDDFAKPDPFEALPSPTTKAAPAPVAARPSTPTPTRSKYTPGRDGPATSGRWQPLDGRESAESFDDD
jgi:hypothetical protein